MSTIEQIPAGLTRAQSLDARPSLSGTVDHSLKLIHQSDVAYHNRMVSVSVVLQDHFGAFTGPNDFRRYYLYRMTQVWPDEPNRPVVQLDFLTTWYGYASRGWGVDAMAMFTNGDMSETVIEWLFADRDSTSGVTATLPDGSTLLRCQVITKDVYLDLLHQVRAASKDASHQVTRKETVSRFKEIALSRQTVSEKDAARAALFDARARNLLVNAVRAEKRIARKDGAMANRAIDHLVSACARDGILAIKGDAEENAFLLRLGQTLMALADTETPPDFSTMDQEEVQRIFQILIAALSAIMFNVASHDSELELADDARLRVLLGDTEVYSQI